MLMVGLSGLNWDLAYAQLVSFYANYSERLALLLNNTASVALNH
jgi:hypothetical protein